MIHSTFSSEGVSVKFTEEESAESGFTMFQIRIFVPDGKGQKTLNELRRFVPALCHSLAGTREAPHRL